MNVLRKITIFILMIVSVSAYGQTLSPKQDAKGRFGYVDESGKWIIKAKYTDAEKFDKYGYAFVKKGDVIGLIDKKGQELIKPQFRKSSYLSYFEAYVLDDNGGKFTYFDCIDGLQFPIKNYQVENHGWFDILSFIVGLAPASTTSESTTLFGISIGNSGAETAEKVDTYKRKVFGLTANNPQTKVRMLFLRLSEPMKNEDGNLVTELCFSDKEYKWTVCGKTLVIQKSGYGSELPSYVLNDGKLLVSGQNKRINLKEDGSCFISGGSNNDLDVNISVDGEMFFKEGRLFKHPQTEKYAYFNNDYDFSFDEKHYKYDSVSEWAAGIYMAYMSEKTLIFKYFSELNDGRAFELDNKYSFKSYREEMRYICVEDKTTRKLGIYKDGKLIIPVLQDSIHYLGRGIILFKGGVTSLMDYDGSRILDINSKYEILSCTPNMQYICVEDKATKKQGLYKKENLIIPVAQDSIDYWSWTKTADEKGGILVFKGGVKSFMNCEGKYITDGTKYDAIRISRNGLVYSVKKGNQIGLLDRETGKVIVPCTHHIYAFYGNGYHLMANESGNRMVVSVYDRKGTLRDSKSFMNTSEYLVKNYVVSWAGQWAVGETEEMNEFNSWIKLK